MAVRMSDLNRMDGRQLMGLGWKVLGDERRQTAEFLRVIATIDRRGLYRDQGFSSMFALCVDGYHLSKGQAYVRIASARAGRRFPVVFQMIARGEIHMTGVALLEKHLTPENHEALLRRAVHKTKDQIAEIVASIAPKPDAPMSIRRIPQPKGVTPSQPGEQAAAARNAEGVPWNGEPAVAPATGVSAEQAGLEAPCVGLVAPGPRGAAPASAPMTGPRGAARDEITPRSPDRFMVRFTASKRCTELMRQAKDLMSHEAPNIDAGELTEAAYELLVQALLKKKHKVTDRPRKPKRKAEKKAEGSKPRKKSRHIPAQVKREVWERDGGCCTYVSEDGRRCCATRLLEYDHVELKTHGGEETADNLRLRCRAHNRLTAEQALGDVTMTLLAQGFRPVPKEGTGRASSGSAGRTESGNGAQRATPEPGVLSPPSTQEPHRPRAT